jgi:SpoVK/Ycf46/Vps4 family AAA+-type ATPase
MKVYGIEGAWRALEEAILWPRRYAELYQRFAVQPCVGLLLFGPPGTGKTSLAKLAAKQLGASFFNLKVRRFM